MWADGRSGQRSRRRLRRTPAPTPAISERKEGAVARACCLSGMYDQGGNEGLAGFMTGSSVDLGFTQTRSKPPATLQLLNKERDEDCKQQLLSLSLRLTYLTIATQCLSTR